VLSRCLLAWNTLGIRGRLAESSHADAQKNGLQVWTCRPPRNLKVYKINNLKLILTRCVLNVLAISIKLRGKGWNLRSIDRRKDPIEGQDTQKPGFRNLAVPAATRAIADNFLFAEDLHRVVFRERRLGALSLQIDIVPTFGTRKDNSVSFTHTPS